MQSTNVEYLFENYTIKEIEEIQKKLQADVEKKKEDLKQLVGERYRDLIEAADTIQDMNKSVSQVLDSIDLLQNKTSSLFKPNQPNQPRQVITKVSTKNREFSDKIENDYDFGIYMKTLINASIHIWSYLENEDLLNATITYLFSKHICTKIKESSYICPLFEQYNLAIDRFKFVIVNECWHYFSKYLKEENIDETTNLDVFCCLAILNEKNSYEIFTEFLERRSLVITKSLQNNNNFQIELSNFVNSVFNTIKLLNIIFIENRDDTQSKINLSIRLKEIMNIVYLISFCEQYNIKKPITKATGSVMPNRFGFHFRPIININSFFVEKNIIQEDTISWINSVKDKINQPMIKLLNNFNSIKEICVMLQNINRLINGKDKKLEWEENCENVMGNYWPIWDEFLMNNVLNKMYDIFEEKVSIAFDVLKKNISNFNNGKFSNQEIFQVSNFIWNDCVENNNLFKKTNGHLPQFQSLCIDFDNYLKKFLNDINLLVDENSKIPLSHQNLIDLNENLTKTCKNLINDLCKFLQSLVNENYCKNTNLFCAQLLRFVSRACPSLRQCFTFLPEKIKISSKWSQIKEEIDSFIILFFKNLFQDVISNVIKNEYQFKIPPNTGHSSDIGHSTDMGNSLDIEHLYLPWAKITITDESEDGKILSSVIEIPSQISFPLYNTFIYLSNEMNNVAGHVLSRSIIINVLITLSKRLNDSYSELYEQLAKSDLTANIKQIYALQFYFDLQFVKQFLNTSRDESVKTEALQSIHERMLSFESLIDPFDLHVFFPHIQTNLAKIGKTCSLLFGLLLPEYIFITDSKSNSQIQNEMYKESFLRLKMLTNKAK